MKYLKRHLVAIRAIFKNYQGGKRLTLLGGYIRMLTFLPFLRKSPDGTKKISFLGHTIFFVGSRNFLSLVYELYLEREYEFYTSQKSPFIIDCGSNIGMSILFFKDRYPEARVIAFEPDRSTYEILKKNIEANNLKHVEAHHAALYDEKGTVSFYTDAENPSSLNMSLVSGAQKIADAKMVSVPAMVLSDYIDKEVDFLKLDIEGAEGRVLRELERSGKLGMVREMILEYHESLTREDDAQHLSSVLGVLERAGMNYVVGSKKVPPYPRYKGRPSTLLVYAYRT